MDLSEKLKNLSPEQRELLQKKLRAKQKSGTQLDIIGKRLDPSSYPMSAAQMRLWFLDQLDSGSAFYNVPSAVYLTGKLDAAVMEAAINKVVARHEILRSFYAVDDNGSPIQLVQDKVFVPLQRIDLNAPAAVDVDKHISNELAKLASIHFDLSTAPLLRAYLFVINEREQVLLLNMHHIIVDGWSIGIILQEIILFYVAGQQGQSLELDEPKLQFADYAAWQNSKASESNLDKQLNYWTTYLQGMPPVLQLLSDSPRPAVMSHKGDHYRFKVDRETTAAFRHISRERQASMFNTLMAATQLFFSKYTGQKDFGIGAPIANRQRKELESIVGFFVNTIVLRAQFDKDINFLDLVNRVKNDVLIAAENQDVPFEKIVQAVQPHRQLSHSPLFQVMFDFQASPLKSMSMPGLEIDIFDADMDAAKFDLLFVLMDRDDTIHCTIEYNADLFERSTIELLSKYYLTLLKNIAADPTRRLSQLELVDDSQKHALIQQAQDTATNYPSHLCVNELFEAQAALTPDAIALEFKNDTVTYDELNSRANQVAHFLRDQGVKPEAVVAIYMERSIEMIVATLAIAKAGGVYLPLDTDYPQDRLNFMFSDSNAILILTTSNLVSNIPSSNVPVICLDTEWDSILKYSRSNPANLVTPENLIYTMYTSGSTGRPKGTTIRHKGIVRLVKNTNYLEFSADLVFLQAAAFAFDAATLEIWGSLLNGAKLVLLPPGKPSLQELGDIIQRKRISVLWLTAGLFHVMVDEQPDSLANVTYLMAGGDVLSVPHVEKMLSHPGEHTLINGYGPTENTTFTTCYRMQKGQTFNGSIPIGRPIANTQIYVVDEKMNLLPAGVPGELLVGGDGLARDYLNRPDLTAEKFVPNPFATAPGERLYRTGDLVRWTAGNVIEFLGRIDNQVKVRGFRIELGEIEATIKHIDGVRDAVVLAKSGASEDKQLVAYVVPADDASLTDAGLKKTLSQKLPDYMVPSFVLFLDKLPVNANGKVDRKALPDPAVAITHDNRDYSAPRNPLEEYVASLWQDVLGIKNLGIHDNFFDRGGNSLKAAVLMNRLQKDFGESAHVTGVFKAPTIAEFSMYIAEFFPEQIKSRFGSDSQQDFYARTNANKDITRQSRKTDKLTLIPHVARDQELELSFAQQRLWFLDQLQPGTNQYNIPIAVRLNGKVDLDRFQQALNVLIARHETLRTTFDMTTDGHARQIIHPVLKIDLPLVDLTSYAEDRVKLAHQVANAEAAKPFDLQHGPLMRAKMIRLDEDDHILVVVMHHIISDGWSVNIFIQEFAAVREALHNNEPITLPPLLIQYADFAAWQRRWLADDRLDRELSYWKNQLAAAPPALELPTDRPRSAYAENRGGAVLFDLSSELSHAVKRMTQENGATLFMTLMAAFQVLLARFANQLDILVGTPVANRTRKEIEPLIGFFVNTLVMRADLSDNPSFRKLLERSKTTALDAYDHQSVPFEKLVDALQPERDTLRTPFFQVMFAMQDSALESLDVNDLRLTVFEISSGATKFDMTLSMVERHELLQGQLQYNADLFDEATIQRFIQHFKILLQRITENPDHPVLNVPLLSPDDVTTITRDFNASHHALPDNISLPVLFEEQVARTPNAIAVSDPYQRLSYSELNAWANRYAAFLRDQGVGADSLVGVSTTRSVDSIVAILAALKAGAAYVPLDPDYPLERLEFILHDTGMEFILSQSDVANRLPIASQNVVLMDKDSDKILAYPDKNLPPVAGPENLAYIIYTSGSTGTPKGVMISHRSAYNLFIGMQQRIYANLDQRQLKASLNAPLLFDASVKQLVTLLRGNHLCIIPSAVRTDGMALLQFVQEQQIDVLDCVPSQLKVLITAGLFENGGWVPQAIIPGGEAIDEKTWATLQECDSQVHNMYGPTECTVIASTCFINKGPDRPAIGQPIPNAQIYILDTHLQSVPIGVTGEICISGEGLARGYWNRPALTADKFIPNPFSERGERLYRTGDLGRFRPDGTIEFLGRLDHQVKLRGYRMELGEIEANLQQHREVKEAIVMVREDEPGDKRLACYFICTTDDKPTAVELRDFLQPRLPDYMIPSYFIALEKFPLTPNGKIDRKALPKPTIERSDLASEYAEASTQAEQTLIEIWKQVLGVHDIGIDDNFFELGGDSILSIQVIARAHQQGLRLSPRHIFETPTIRRLANSAQIGVRIQAEQGLVTGEMPLTPIQRWFFEQNFKNIEHWNQSIVLDVLEELDPHLLQLVFDKIVEHHDALRLSFHQDAELWAATIQPPGQTKLQVYDLTGLPDDQVNIELETLTRTLQASHTLSTGSLVQCGYFMLGKNRTDKLFISIHHMAIDGLSWRIILEDFARAYTAAAAGQKIHLPEKTTSFKAWAENLLEYAESAEIRPMPAWLEESGSPLPVDFQRGENTEASAKSVNVELSISDTLALLQEVPAALNTQINDILLTALAMTFEQWTGHPSIRIALEGHGREDIIENVDISRTVGWFTTKYPVTLDLSGATQIADKVQKIKSQLKSGPHNGFNYGILRYLKTKDESAKQCAVLPEPAVSFNYLGQFSQMTNDPRFRLSDFQSDSERDPANHRAHQILVSGKIAHDQLAMSFMYSENFYKSETITERAHNFIANLERLIAYARSSNGDGLSAAVLDELDIQKNDLEDVLSELDFE